MSGMKKQSIHFDNKASGLKIHPAEKRDCIFRRIDWMAFLITFLLSLIVYAITMAPTVTLEDSGELIVAADYLGVPHPPGYPLWTIFAWLFQLVFGFIRYLGHPNPAWGVNLMSGFFGSLSSGLVALLVSRCGFDLLEFRRRASEVMSVWTQNLITGACGITAGLLLTFTPIIWSQCVIAEVYSLNEFLHLMILALAYMWMRRPDDNRLLYGIALTFGVAVTNCQPIMLIIPALMLIIFATDRALFRDCFALGIVLLAGWVYLFRVRPALAVSAPAPHKEIWIAVSILMLLTPAAIWMVSRKLFTEWKRVMIMMVCAGLGLCLFLYMPLASEFNPPMNWGYPRTWEGFKHAVTRGQYQQLTPAIKPAAFIKQAVMYFKELEDQFTLPLVLMAVLPIFYIRRIRRKEWVWLGSLLIAFAFLGVGLLALINPGHDIQSMFIARVQFVQSVAVFALLIGYGLVLGLTFISSLAKSRVVLCGAVLIMLLSPLCLIWKNVYDKELIRSYGASDLQGHDFGWQFGNYQLRGAKAITEELKQGETPLPNPDFPAEMGTSAIFFGGTDPGRFVPTYMIYSALVRPDVFLITQNALADNTYMSVMRDLYGDEIWIPTPKDTNLAFQKYVDDVRAGRIPPNAAVKIDKNGRVSVQGVQGVMEINGIICKMIFENNKSKHDFYVEESYVIRWMYPYLEPHGLIMKINKEPLPKLTDEMIKNDMEFWNWYTNRLMNNNKFLRDAVARKTFSKLRCAIAGLYSFRQLFNEAEAAFRQAIELFPVSPEANFRLADLYLQRGRFADAYSVMERNRQQDQRNEKIKGFMKQIKELEQRNARMVQIQTLLSKGAGTLDMVFELAMIYKNTGKQQPFYNLTRQIIDNTNIPSQAYLKVAEMCVSCKPQHLDLVEEAFKKFLDREPVTPRIWIELACVQVAGGQNDDALKSLQKAVSTGGEPIKGVIRKDERLASLRSIGEFKKLTASSYKPLGSVPGSFFP